MKTCPFCAEEIQDAAIVCKHCNRDLAVAPPPLAGVATTSPVTKQSPLTKTVSTTKGVALMAIVFGFFFTMGGGTGVGIGIVMLWLGFAFLISGGVITRFGGGFICAMAISGIGMAWSGSAPSSPSSSVASATTPNATPAPAPVPAVPPLALLASSGQESDGGGYFVVEGQVKNLSGESMKNVMAVATWYDKDGSFITSDDAMIDYNPILPGQTSPFKTMSRSNPAMSKYSIAFKELLGGTLAVDDQRKK